MARRFRVDFFLAEIGPPAPRPFDSEAFMRRLRESEGRIAANNERIAELRGECVESYPGGIGEGAL